MNTNEQQLTLALQDKDEAQDRYEAASANHKAAVAKYDAAVTKYDAAAAKYEANEDDKKELKLKQLKDEAYAMMESADANLQSADANLQSANKQITLTLQRLPAVVSRKREAEADSYEEQGLKIPSAMTHRAKELLAMIRTLRPGGGVEVRNVKEKLPQSAADDDDEEETAAGTVTLDYLQLPEGVQFLTTKGKFGRRLLDRKSTRLNSSH